MVGTAQGADVPMKAPSRLQRRPALPAHQHGRLAAGPFTVAVSLQRLKADPNRERVCTGPQLH